MQSSSPSRDQDGPPVTPLRLGVLKKPQLSEPKIQAIPLFASSSGRAGSRGSVPAVGSHRPDLSPYTMRPGTVPNGSGRPGTVPQGINRPNTVPSSTTAGLGATAPMGMATMASSIQGSRPTTSIPTFKTKFQRINSLHHNSDSSMMTESADPDAHKIEKQYTAGTHSPRQGTSSTQRPPSVGAFSRDLRERGSLDLSSTGHARLGTPPGFFNPSSTAPPLHSVPSCSSTASTAAPGSSWASPRGGTASTASCMADCGTATSPLPDGRRFSLPFLGGGVGGALDGASRHLDAAYPLCMQKPALSGPGGPGGRGDKSTVFHDLLEATRKSYAAGMGDMDLQQLEWQHPEFKKRLLKGPLSPESLKLLHGLTEPDIIKLYRVLYLYTVGFCSAVLEPTQTANRRDQLLEGVFKAYAALWDEAVGVSFESELVEALRHKTDAVMAMNGMNKDLNSTKAESEELKGRLNEFVRGNIDNLMAHRLLKDKSASLEGEVTMLSNANDHFSLKLAGAEIKVESLLAQLADANQRTLNAKAVAADADKQTVRIRNILSEQKSVMSRQYFQIVELERAVMETNSEKAELAASLATTTEKLTHVSGTTGGIERQLAEKTRAYRLLHADYKVKMHDLDVVRAANVGLEEKVAEMHETFQTATRQIQKAKKDAEKYRTKWEHGKMYTEDLESGVTRLARRNKELVKSYWPIMKRMRDVESDNRKLHKRNMELEARFKTDQDELVVLREENKKSDLVRKELKVTQAELSIKSVDISPAALAVLHPDAAEARSYVRISKNKIADLTKQLVHLVDLHSQAAMEKRGAKKEAVRLRDLVESLQSQLVVRTAIGGAGDVAVMRLQKEMEDTHTLRQQDLEQMHKLQDKVKEYEELLATREQWIRVVSDQVTNLTFAVEDTLMRDPDAPKSFAVQLAILQLEQSAPKGNDRGGSDGGGGNGGDGAGGGAGGGGAASGGAAGPSNVGDGAVGGGADASDRADAGAASDRGDAVEGGGSPKGSTGSSAAGSTADTAEEKGTTLVLEPVEKLPEFAMGTLATAARIHDERSEACIRLCLNWEKMADGLDRMMEWASKLSDNKQKVIGLHSLSDQYKAAKEALSKADIEVLDLSEKYRAERKLCAERGRKIEENKADLEEAVRKAADLEAGRLALDSALSATRDELEDVRNRLGLIEEEYWQAKSTVLTAELSTGELKAARDRAVAESERAVAECTEVMAQAKEHRTMRFKLESDLVGCKAWIRSMEETERKFGSMVAELDEAMREKEVAVELTLELRDRIAYLEGQVKVQSINERAAGAQVQHLLRELKSSDFGGGLSGGVNEPGKAASLDAIERQALIAERNGAKELLVAEQSRRQAVEERLQQSQASLEILAVQRDQLEAHIAELSEARQKLLASSTPDAGPVVDAVQEVQVEEMRRNMEMAKHDVDMFKERALLLEAQVSSERSRADVLESQLASERGAASEAIASASEAAQQLQSSSPGSSQEAAAAGAAASASAREAAALGRVRQSEAALEEAKRKLQRGEEKLKALSAATTAANRGAAEAQKRMHDILSELAGARRTAELATGDLKICEADKLILVEKNEGLVHRMAEHEDESKVLQKQIWDMQLLLQGSEKEKREVLMRLVDTTSFARRK